MECGWCILLMGHLQDQNRNMLQLSGCGQRLTTVVTQQAPGGLQRPAHWMLLTLDIHLKTSWLPGFPPSLPPCLSPSVPPSLPPCLPPCLPASLPLSLPHSLPVSLPASLPASLPVSLPPCLPASLSPCLPASWPLCCRRRLIDRDWRTMGGRCFIQINISAGDSVFAIVFGVFRV